MKISKKIFLVPVSMMLALTVAISSVSADSQSFSVPYQVQSGGTPGANVSVSLNANPSNVGMGGSSTLTYSPMNAVSCTGSGGNFGGGKNSSSGSHNHSTGGLTSNTTYTISCTGSNGSVASATATVTVGGAPGPSVSISANPSNVTVGGSSTISWSSSGTSSCSTNGGPWGSGSGLSTNGSQNRSDFGYSGSFTYSITCQGQNGGYANASTTVTAGGQPPQENISVTLYANGQRPSLTVERGTFISLNWTSTGSPDMCNTSWEGVVGNTGSNGVGSANYDTNFSITCYKNGAVASSDVNVYTTTPNISVTLYANGQRPEVEVPIDGPGVTLNWTSTGSPDGCNVSWDVGVKANTGSIGVGMPSQRVNYAIDCHKNGAVATSYVNVTPVLGNQNIDLRVNDKKAATVNQGQTVTLSWYVDGAVDDCWAGTVPGHNWTGRQGFGGWKWHSKVVGPVTERVNYQLHCVYQGHQFYDIVWVDVIVPPPPPPPPPVPKNITIIEF